MPADQSPLLIKTALLSACAVGAWASYKLLTTFSSVLKPLAFSLMAYAIIQYVSEKIYEFLYERCCAQEGNHPELLTVMTTLPPDQNRCLRCLSWLARKILTPCNLQAQEGGLTADLLAPAQQQRHAARRKCLHLIGRRFCKFSTAIVLLASCLLMYYLIHYFIIEQLLQMDWTPYKNGLLEVWNCLKGLANRDAPSEETNAQLETTLQNAVQKYAAALGGAAAQLVGLLSNAIQEIIFFLIYLILWFSAPCKALRPFVKIAGTYMTLKTICNGVYAALVLVVLQLPIPGCRFSFDLAVAIALCCFFLAYIPEIGDLVASGMPLMFVVLDARVKWPDRVFNGLVVILVMFGIKFLVGNFLQAKLMGSNPALAGNLQAAEAHATQETHPALVLVLVMIAASVWDVSGMIVCVPLIGLVRHYVTVEFENAGKKSSTSSGSMISVDTANA